MKLVTSLVAVGLIASCWGSLSVQAADTEAQALAREALAKKMRELQPGSVAATSAPVKVPAAPIAQPAPNTPTPVTSTPPPARMAPTAPRDAAAAKARQAIEQKLREAEGQPAVAVTPPNTAPVTPLPPPPARTAPATSVPPPQASPPPPVAGAVTPAAKSGRAAPEQITQAREAMHDKMNSLGPISPSDSEPVMAPGKNPRPVSPKTAALSFPAIPGPASPLSGTKQQRLSELLRRYQADEITPQQYHVERAKLISEP